MTISLRAFAAACVGLALAPAIAADAPANLQHGRQLAQACAACHGADGNTSDPQRYPNLAAQAPAYVELQLENFKSGERPNPVMKPIAAQLKPSDMRDLGAYYGAQAAKPQPSSNRRLEGQGRRIYMQGSVGGASACASCHGADGHGQGAAPRVASQPAPYLLEQLRVYSTVPSFNNPLAMQMKGVAVKLKADEMKAAAAYIATLP